MSRPSNLLLTSSGIYDSPTVLPALEARVAGLHTAAIVTTASRDHKERNKRAVATREALHGLGFGRVDFIDVEFEDAEVLKRYHVVYIVGGHPFYLMHHLRRSGADAILREINEAGKALIIGSSAGAVVLGPDLRIVSAFDRPRQRVRELRRRRDRAVHGPAARQQVEGEVARSGRTTSHVHCRDGAKD